MILAASATNVSLVVASKTCALTHSNVTSLARRMLSAQVPRWMVPQVVVVMGIVLLIKYVMATSLLVTIAMITASVCQSIVE